MHVVPRMKDKLLPRGFIPAVRHRRHGHGAAGSQLTRERCWFGYSEAGPPPSHCVCSLANGSIVFRELWAVCRSGTSLAPALP